MVGQKQRIIRRFEKKSREHLKERGLSQTFLDTTMFSLADIKKTIFLRDQDEIEKQCFEEINRAIDKLFPKGDKRRGDALVLQAVAFLSGKKFVLSEKAE